MNRVINFDDPKQKALFLDGARRLTGSYRIDVRRYRVRRSDKQNRAYWDMICEPFADWITANWGEHCTPEEAHEILKMTFLRKQRVNPLTGELHVYPAPSKELDTAQFSEYFDRCRDLLAQMCNIIVEDPDPAWRARAEVKA